MSSFKPLTNSVADLRTSSGLPAIFAQSPSEESDFSKSTKSTHG